MSSQLSDRFPTFIRAWQGWKRIAAKIAHFQGNLILSLIYFVVVAPTGLMFRLFRQDPLEIVRPKRSSYWVPRKPIESVSEFLKREF